MSDLDDTPSEADAMTASAVVAEIRRANATLSPLRVEGEPPDEHAQPLPTPSNGPAIVDLVLARPMSEKARGVIAARRAIGRSRYGVDLQAFNGRDVQRDFTDEAADAVNYAMQGVVEAKEGPAQWHWERRFGMAVAMLEDAVDDADRSGRHVLELAREHGLIGNDPASPDPSPRLSPGSTWTGPDGTVYDVVRPEEVGDRPRWWISEWARQQIEGGNMSPAPDDHMMLHCETAYDCTEDTPIVLALVMPDLLRTSLRSILGLPADADDEAVRTSVEGLKDAVKRSGDHHLATQATLDHVIESRDDWHRIADERSAALAEAHAQLEEATGKLTAVRDRVVTVADEAFGPFPVQTAEEALTAIERGVFELRQSLAAEHARFEAEETEHLATLASLATDLAVRITAIVREHVIGTPCCARVGSWWCLREAGHEPPCWTPHTREVTTPAIERGTRSPR